MKAFIISLFALLFFANNSFSQNLEAQLADAVSSNNLKEVKKLVEKKGADVNGVWRINDAIFVPLLVKTVMENNTQMATYLIEKGANVNCKDGFGMTSIMWAANNNNIELVKLLLAKGADKNVEANGMTALKAAQGNGFKEIEELLK